MMRALPTSTLFPYTTLLRSVLDVGRRRGARGGGAGSGCRVTAAQADRVRRADVRAGGHRGDVGGLRDEHRLDRKSTRLNSSHVSISYAVFCLKKKKQKMITD